MQRLLLALSFVIASVFLSGCMATMTTRTYVYDPPPAYVYAYPDGCWADDVWYSPCPWRPGPSYGYYVYSGGIYVWRPGYSWGYRPGYPPPRRWHPHVRPAPPRHHHPPRGHHPAPPRRR